MADQDDELVDAVRELARTIDALRTELEGSHPRRRPPLRPPTPRELLRFTDDVALPATLAVLETSVRALEAFQRSLKLLRTEREARDRTTAAAETTSERANELRRTTLSQLDTVLAELQRAASGDGLPANEQARDLLEEARELRDDVDTRLRNAADREREATDPDRTTSEGSVAIDIEEGPPTDSETDDDDSDPAVDVDAELETLRDQYADADDDGPHEAEDSSDDEDSVADDGGADDGGNDPGES
ncbi:DUF7547 family protein [Natrinema longum]|uniref:Uncharacterized protein n=1 Tax=Natrinema longum TaxID=370324 RepID=A0A8A2UAK1_9EURY|nr:hypothetical protein [Natrinema longum]MBZ6496307.1 hypothetical protein [Natrinema longum]QSW85779.1 hypothetical protein J0X27_02770 [Natrinema longum]